MEWAIDQLELSSQVQPLLNFLYHQIEHLRRPFEAFKASSEIADFQNEPDWTDHICNMYDIVFIAIH